MVCVYVNTIFLAIIIMIIIIIIIKMCVCVCIYIYPAGKKKTIQLKKVVEMGPS